MCGIFKKKLNLLKQKYYEEISTIVFFIRGLLIESLLFTKKSPTVKQKTEPTPGNIGYRRTLRKPLIVMSPKSPIHQAEKRD